MNIKSSQPIKSSLASQSSSSSQAVRSSLPAVPLLLTDQFTHEAVLHLRGALPCELQFSKTRTPTKEELNTCKGLLIRSRTEITKELLQSAPQLQVVVTATSGFDHIDLLACREAKVSVFYTPEANAQSAAELTLFFVLGLQRQFTRVHQVLKSHSWKENLKHGREAKGQILGLIGLGRVGSKVASMAQALGLQVLAHDPYQTPEIYKDLSVERVGLTELLIQADMVSLHVPYTPKTHHLINRRTLKFMNPQSLIINTSRGAVINEYDLVQALLTDQIQGAALDVFESEPLPQHSPLRKLPQVLLSPHIGAYTEEAFHKASYLAVEKICSFFNGDHPSNLLPPKAEWYESSLL